MPSLPPPTTTQPHYGAHLGDDRYWKPYVDEALARHDLPRTTLEAPFVGTFPTFLVGDLVVKLFGDAFDGAQAFDAELAMGRLLSGVPEIPAPAVVAAGQLFDDPDRWRWPYLIMERLTGRAARDVPSTDSLRRAAERLGPALARLHGLPAPAVIAARDPVPALRAAAPGRLRGFGLPEHLVEQVPDFLRDASETRILVHADVTADHVFVDREGDLAGIIDWADAITADPWYELVALRFDALRGDPDLFAIMLDGYGWPTAPDFPIRALQGVLEFQFDAISAIAGLVDLPRIRDLRELADRLYGRFC